METVNISKINEAFIRIDASRGVFQELKEVFTFFVQSAIYDQRFKMKMWDGKIRMLKADGSLYYGLLDDVISYCIGENYEVVIDEAIRADNLPKYPEEELDTWIAGLDLVDKKRDDITPHDYQVVGFKHALTRSHCLLESPTASGKSLMLYMLARKFLEENKKIIFIVDKIDLVEQLYDDFTEYSWKNGFDVEANFHKLHGKQSKTFDKNALITTWQSVRLKKQDFFDQFDAVIGDEAHTFKATSLVKIMESLKNTVNRVGATGTSDEEKGDHKVKVNRPTIEGLFGKIKVLAKTSELIDSGHLSKLEINCVMLSHDKIAREYLGELTSTKKYQKEIEYLNTSESRNNFIANIATKLEGNTIVMYRYIEHGKELLRLIKERNPDRQVSLINGKVPTEERKAIRKHAIEVGGDIIVASYATFAKGINIPTIENIVMAHPIKSPYNLKQTIGRGLRVAENKSKCVLIDIADNIKKGSKTNHTYVHAMDRYKLYKKEGMRFSFSEVNLDG